MRNFLKDNNAKNLIVFFAGWGCDENQFINLKDTEDDILILYGYQDLSLNFDFGKYDNIDIIAYSAGVFISSIMGDKIPNIRKRIAINGNPFLFDEKLGLSKAIVEICQNITLDNYLEFRRNYMVYSEGEYQKFNELQVNRTVADCEEELLALKELYANKKNNLKERFDRALMSDNDRLFNLSAQEEFYRDRIKIIPNTRHHVFFKFTSFREIIEFAFKS